MTIDDRTDPDGAALPDGTDLLDPSLAPLLDLVPDLDLATADLPQARADFLELIRSLMPPSDRVEVTEHTVPDDRVPGSRATVRVHRAVGAEGTLPALVNIHGGGYIIGSNVMDDGLFAHWSPRLGVVGISVEYRLAPEHPYPAPLDDCYAALLWAHDHAEELGIDPARIGIGGGSAGGGLAAGLAIRARDAGEVPVAFQLLECPMIDDRQQSPSSRLDGLKVWNREANTFGWRSYLGDLYGTDDVPGAAAAAREADLRGLPPAYVAVGAADGFRDEDVEYALRLNQAGVPTELHVYPGVPHGVGMFIGTPWAERWQRDVDDWLERMLRPEGVGGD